MKKWYGLVGAVLLYLLPASAENRVIEVKELPRAAQEFLDRYFDTVEIQLVTVDHEWFDRDYKVHFTNGSSVNFDRQGAWNEVDCRQQGVPAAIVPKQIRQSVSERFAGRSIRKIERDREGYEVELSNGIGLKYNHRYRLTEIDD